MFKNIFISSFYIGITATLFSCNPTTSRNKESDFDVLTKDTLYHNLFSLDTTDAGCSRTYHNCPAAKISYPVFITPDSSLNAYLNTQILRAILYKTDTSAYTSVTDYLTTFFNENALLKREGNYDDESSAWSRENEVTYYAKIGRYLTLKEYKGIYEGGAHPNAYIRYTVFDLIDRKQLNISGLINATDTALLRIGEHYFRKDNTIDDSVSLTDAGFFIFGEGAGFEDGPDYGKFHFSDNFALTNEGVEFIYNTYEIGPYAVGAPAFTIPYSDVQAYLKLKIW